MFKVTLAETRLSSKGAKVRRDGADPPPSQGYIVQYKLFPNPVHYYLLPKDIEGAGNMHLFRNIFIFSI